MNTTTELPRREALKQMALAAGGVLLAGDTVAVIAQSKPRVTRTRWNNGRVAVRRSVAEMKPDDAQLQMLRAAVGEMRKRSAKNPLDPQGWVMNASLHGVYCATHEFERQVHYCWLVLPWHRGMLYFTERKMQKLINEPSLALPYWDWTTTPKIPAQYWPGFGGVADNPLNDDTRIQGPDDVMPADFLDTGPVLRAPNFNVMGGYPKHDPDDEQIEGILEQGCHNNTHNWIGGNMAGFPSSGFDPLFYAHHNQVDRLWEAWLKADAAHKNPTDPRFLNYSFIFHDEKNAQVRITIKDLLDTEALGYRFDSLAFRDKAKMALLPSHWQRDDAIRPQYAALKPLAEPERRTVVAALQSGRQAVLLKFERVQVPVQPLCVRVFIARKGEPLRYEPNAPGFAGTFTILPVQEHRKGMPHQYVSMQMEISSAIADLIRANAELEVTLVPVALKGRVLPTEPLKLTEAKLTLAGRV